MTSALLTGTMNTVEAARHLGVSVATLKRWRSNGQGPSYIRLSSAIIRYRETDLDRWILSSRQDGQKEN